MNEYLIYAVVALAGAALRHYFPALARYLPLRPPAPGGSPAPGGPPEPGRPLADCLAWLIAAKAGLVPVTVMERRTLQSIIPLAQSILEVANE